MAQKVFEGDFVFSILIDPKCVTEIIRFEVIKWSTIKKYLPLSNIAGFF